MRMPLGIHSKCAPYNAVPSGGRQQRTRAGLHNGGRPNEDRSEAVASIGRAGQAGRRRQLRLKAVDLRKSIGGSDMEQFKAERAAAGGRPGGEAVTRIDSAAFGWLGRQARMGPMAWQQHPKLRCIDTKRSHHQ